MKIDIYNKQGKKTSKKVTLNDDVFKIEPPEENNPLLKNDKVFLSPHTAAFTEECMIRMGKETIQNIIDFFDKRLDKSKIVKL